MSKKTPIVLTPSFDCGATHSSLTSHYYISLCLFCNSLCLKEEETKNSFTFSLTHSHTGILVLNFLYLIFIDWNFSHTLATCIWLKRETKLKIEQCTSLLCSHHVTSDIFFLSFPFCTLLSPPALSLYLAHSHTLVIIFNSGWSVSNGGVFIQRTEQLTVSAQKAIQSVLIVLVHLLFDER